MIVKILSSAASFKGVNYNTTKIDNNKGELLKVSGFGPLQGMDRIRPEDYVNYLKMVSAQNKNIKSPQLHVALSTKGRSHSRSELMDIADKWLAAMGYSNQPYLIIFHKDTKNNHVHIVSTRVDKDGNKISSAFEKNRAIQNLNKVMGLDEGLQAKNAFEKALTYNFSSKAQFMMILESSNYIVRERDAKIELIKFGKVAGVFERKDFDKKLSEHQQQSKSQQTDPSSVLKHLRAKQLKAIFNKYVNVYSTELTHRTESLSGGREKVLNEYTSEFSNFMKEKFGLDILYHSKNGLPPYGYSIIDHSGRNVFKGGEIMDLRELLNNTITNDEARNEDIGSVQEDIEIHEHDATQDRSNSYNESRNSNHSFDDYFKNEPSHQSEAQPSDNLLQSSESEIVQDRPIGSSYERSDDEFITYSDQITVEISDDIDDEAILGRNRRRQKKARTNTR